MPESSIDATANNAAIESTQFVESFPPTVKKGFESWINDRKNRSIFDSDKRIKYKWVLNASDASIHGSKKKKRVKFNERHDALTFFMLKDNQLHRKASKPEEFDRIVACDYNAADIIEKVHNELEHAGNSKIFRRINERYYEIFKVMVE